jgi:hypothetical protein
VPDRRIARLTPGFWRARQRLGITSGSPRGQAVAATIRPLADAKILPEHSDYETSFAPGRAFVRRVPRHNLWIDCRFDDDIVTVFSIFDQPPVPAE